jgi:hypothetical protein
VHADVHQGTRGFRSESQSPSPLQHLTCSSSSARVAAAAAAAVIATVRPSSLAARGGEDMEIIEPKFSVFDELGSLSLKAAF